MNWILTGLLLGSIVTSTHETEEACLGRRAALLKLREGPSSVECHRVTMAGGITSSGTVMCFNSNGTNCR